MSKTNTSNVTSKWSELIPCECRYTKYIPADTETMSFSIYQFFITFLYHIGYPFSIPLVVYLDGWKTLQAMEFIPRNARQVIFSHIIPMGLIVCNLLHWSGASDPLHGGASQIELAVADLYYVFRCLVIAVKYGFMSPTDYFRFTKIATCAEAREINRKQMLVSGWLYPDSQLLIEEVRAAAQRTQIEPAAHIFVFYDDAKSDVAELLGNNTTKLSSGEKVSKRRASEFIRKHRAISELDCEDVNLTFGDLQEQQTQIKQLVRTATPVYDLGPMQRSRANVAADKFNQPNVVKPFTYAHETTTKRNVVNPLQANSTSQSDKRSYEKASPSYTNDVDAGACPTRQGINWVGMGALAVSILLRAQPAWPRKVASLALVAAIFHAVMNILLLTELEVIDSFDPTAANILSRVFLMLAQIALEYVLFLYLLVGVLDYYRRAQTSELLTAITRSTKEIISITDVAGTGVTMDASTQATLEDIVRREQHNRIQDAAINVKAFKWNPPIVDLSNPSNAFAWYKLRILLGDVGRKYATRVQTYLTLLLFLLTYMNIVLIIGVFTDPQEIFKGVGVIVTATTLLDTVVFIGLSLIMILFGAMANSQFESQQDVLAQGVVDLQELRSIASRAGEEKRAANLETSVAVIQTIREALDSQNRQNPLKVLGIRADMLLLRAIFTGLISLAGAIGGKLGSVSDAI